MVDIREDVRGRTQSSDSNNKDVTQRGRFAIADSTTSLTPRVKIEVHTHADVIQVIQQALHNSRLAATDFNEASSRAHNVYILETIDEAGGGGSRGSLLVADLAGSEAASAMPLRGADAQVTAARQQEQIHQRVAYGTWKRDSLPSDVEPSNSPKRGW